MSDLDAAVRGLPAATAVALRGALSDAGGGGGSAFAHLTEDAEGHIVADEVFVVGDPSNQDYGTLLYKGSISLNANSTDTDIFEIYSLDKGARNPSIRIDGDGSLHWGDGTAGPDVSLTRENEVVALEVGLAQQSLTVGLPSSTGVYVAIGTNPNGDNRPSVEFYDGTHDVYLQVDADGDLFVPGKGKVAFQ